MSQTPESLGTGIGPLLADFIPLMPSGARRAGAAQVMAARVGREPSVLVDQPRITQLLALGLGAAGGALTADQSKAVHWGAMAAPIGLVQLMRHLEMRSIQRDYDKEKRKRLRDLDAGALLDDSGWFGMNGSARLGAVSAYETMRDRKYRGYSSVAEAGDALHLAASGLAPMLGLPASALVSVLDNREAQNRRNLHKKAAAEFVKEGRNKLFKMLPQLSAQTLERIGMTPANVAARPSRGAVQSAYEAYEAANPGGGSLNKRFAMRRLADDETRRAGFIGSNSRDLRESMTPWDNPMPMSWSGSPLKPSVNPVDNISMRFRGAKDALDELRASGERAVSDLRAGRLPQTRNAEPGAWKPWYQFGGNTSVNGHYNSGYIDDAFNTRPLNRLTVDSVVDRPRVRSGSLWNRIVGRRRPDTYRSSGHEGVVAHEQGHRQQFERQDMSVPASGMIMRRLEPTLPAGMARDMREMGSGVAGSEAIAHWYATGGKAFGNRAALKLPVRAMNAQQPGVVEQWRAQLRQATGGRMSPRLEDRLLSIRSHLTTNYQMPVKQAAAEFVKESVLGFKALTGHTGPIKAFLKQLRADGAAVKRVRPATVGAQLPNTGSLPVGTAGGSGYVRGSWDPALQTFRNTEIEVAKGMPRHTMDMQPDGTGFRFSYGQGVAGGTNPSPIASLLHEGGHHMHHRAMRRAGIGDLTGGHDVPGLPHMDKVLNELGANNSALQFMQQAGAKPEAMAYFKGARAPSFATYVRNLPQTNNPVQERILAAGQHGFTPGYKGLPDFYMGKQADFTEQRNTPAIPLYIAAALAGIAGSAGASHWAQNEITDTPPLGVDKWRDTIRSISGTEPLMASTRGVGNAFFAKPRTEQQAIAVLLEASGLGGQFVDAPGRKPPHAMPSVRDMRQRGVRADTVRDLMQRGIMVADESAGAPVLGHEAGHAKIEETPGMLRFLQRHIYPHNRWVAPAASVGSMAAGLASGSALKGGLYGTGIGLLSGLGTLGPEAGASYHALQHLKGTGDGSLTAEGRKDLLSALSTYLAAAVLPSTLSGAAGGWISGRRRKKEEDEEGVEKAASRWRLLGNIGKVFKAQGGNIDQLAAGQNLAALKQTMGQTMRAPSADKIGQRVLQHERNAMNVAWAPYRGDDDAMKAFVDSTRQRSTHERLFDRFGQSMPSFDEGSRVFRGTVGGNPWGGGAYNGAFHYAAPTVDGAAYYGRQPASFLANEARGALSGGRSTFETVHHYGAGPNQKLWQPWGPEDAITASARQRGRIMRGDLGQLRGNAETAVMRQHNPYLGTAMRPTSVDGAYGASTFFPAGRPGQAAQNYVDQISQTVRMGPDGLPQTMRQQVSGLNTTPWQTSVDASPSLSRLQQRNPAAFQGVMNRRADRMLGPSGFEKAASAKHLLNVAQTLRRITTEGLRGEAADTLARPLGSTARTLQRYFFKHPKISSLGIRPGMPEQKIQALLKGLTDPPAMPTLPAAPPAVPPGAPQQGMLDLFKSGAHPALPDLLAAKEHSDAKRYSIKNRLIRQNMRRKADDWLVDSDDGKGIVGVTHIPTGFRLHMPKAIVDPDVLRYHNAHVSQ